MVGDDSKPKDVSDAGASPKIYPIAASMTLSGNKVDLQIAKLEPSGFIAYVTGGVPHVGVHYMCDIMLPQSAMPFQLSGQVYKTYDHVNKNNGRVDRLVEVLFTKITEAEKAKIRSIVKPDSATS